MNKMMLVFALVAVLSISMAEIANAPIGGTPGGPSTNDGITRVKNSINDMCVQLVTLLPVVAMLMIVIAGVIYAAGQVMGAETRARANVWATAALTGALVGLLIYAIAPTVLQTIYGGQGTEITCK